MQVKFLCIKYYTNVMVILIKFFYYSALALSVFLFSISLVYSYNCLVEFDSPLRHELLMGHAFGFVYGIFPMFMVFGLKYYYHSVFNKIEIKISIFPLLILGLSYLLIFISKLIN
jgi:hypothetical protein